MGMSWHVEPALLAQYAESRTGDALSASIEAHTDSCPQCRALIRPPDVPDVWDAVRVNINAPHPGRLQRLAARVIPQTDALLLAGSAMFRWAWIESIVAAALFASVASLSSSHKELTVLFLLVAPLLPLAAVALAYGPEVDPAHEVAVATPYPQARLFLLRSGAVILATVPITLIAGFLLPAPEWVPTAWLLPAAAMTAIAIAAGTWFESLTGATVLGLGWAAFVGWAGVTDQLQQAFAAPTQLLSLALLTVAAVVIGYRLTRMGTGWHHGPHREGTPS
jgi:hypothetical protein